MKLSFTVNGKLREVDCSPTIRLNDLLRDEFGCTGVKEGCGEGDCGACTILLDGENVPSCILVAGQAAGHEIITIEGVTENGQMSAIQDAFARAGAVQCGYCTPGMILSAKALLDKNPHPTEAEIRTALSGNLCRCTGYTKIVKAVQLAAEEVAE
ncbi:Nicotinate dehydrogenase small FeS subunit [bioreactor metagenome]|uniref:Nicotinate dehydrogenase small FeS subunit n=1 Tax=bioreactor metagenome TaxID=1076179 RepID=A0A645ECZ6_9ZZZZ